MFQKISRIFSAVSGVNGSNSLRGVKCASELNVSGVDPTLRCLSHEPMIRHA